MTTIWRCSIFSVLKLEKLRIHPVKKRVLSNDVEFHLQRQKFTIFPSTTTSPNNKNPLHPKGKKRLGLGLRTISSYLLFALAIILLAVIVKSSFPYPLRASCLVKWQFDESCDVVVCKLREQIENEDEMYCGDYTIKATRIERETNVTDDIDIVFANSTEVGCIALAESKVRNWYNIFDGGRNYCNLRELIVMAGYDSDDFFEETTENAICTQYDMAHCGQRLC